MGYIIEDDEDKPRRYIIEDAARRDPKLGDPEELTFAERYIAPALGLELGDVAGGNLRGSKVGGLMKGLATLGTGATQLWANMSPLSRAVGQDEAVNRRIAEGEVEYQDARKAAGREGFDWSRLAGTAIMSAPIPFGGAATSLAGTVGRGALQGAIGGALEPVVDEGDYWRTKGKDIALGAAVGGIAAPVFNAAARVMSPRASVDPEIKMLRREGVEPTIGQTLGGAFNTAEEKLQSVPILGDFVAMMRERARNQFNNAAINRTLEPVGARVKGSGHKAVAEAGDILSAEYNKALGKVNHVNFDTTAFNQQFDELRSMATGLSEPMQKKFETTLNNVLFRKLSPNGSIAGADLKAVDSELGRIASRYGRSSVASEQELGDAVMQLRAILKDEVGRAYPQIAASLRNSDEGWANLVRVERAAKSAINSEGIFTPGQLNAAVRGSDNSVRGRAVSRGEALMQDLGSAGQRILGNKVPDSGTVGRAIMAGTLGASYFANPAIPAAVAAGTLAYTPPVQNALRAMLVMRPDKAPEVANYLRRLASPGAYAAGAGSIQERNRDPRRR